MNDWGMFDCAGVGTIRWSFFVVEIPETSMSMLVRGCWRFPALNRCVKVDSTEDSGRRKPIWKRPSVSSSSAGTICHNDT